MIYSSTIGPYRWQSKPRFGVRIDQTHDLVNGLLAFYAFNEAAGGSVTDISINNYNLTWQQPSVSWGVGSLGPYGAFLNGTNYGKSIATLFSKQPTAFSCVFRFFTTQSSATTTGALTVAASSNISQPLYLIQQNGTAIRILLGNKSYVTVISTVVPNRWYTVGTSWDIVRNRQIHYVDGKQVSSSVIVWGSVVYPTNLYIGLGFNTTFKGGADFCGVWTRALTGSEHAMIAPNPWQIFKPQIDYSNLYQAILAGQVSPARARVLLGNSLLTLGQPGLLRR